MFRRLVLLGLLLVAAATPLLAKDEWLPVSKEDLALKDNPAQPGAAAMILHREVFTDNAYYWESNYTRIKIFTDEGKLRSFVNVYLNDEDIRFAQGKGTPVKDGDEISVIPAIAGG